MKNWRFWLFILTLSIGCKKPYNPKVINSPRSYLIVEGTINTNDTTTIKLSRTVNLTSTTTTNPVAANVTVECDNGSNYGLYEAAPGVYKLIGTTLDSTRKFRLRISTPDDGKEYLSDYEQAKAAPPIDSIGFNLTGKGIQIYANTHDPNNNTHYYRFDYLETWRFHSMYNSGYISNGAAIVPRSPDQRVYYCFANNASTSIVLGSSAKLKQDVLFQAPVTAIDATSEKIELKYSILLREYALTANAYKFWETLKKNTEQLGSIFDAEPTTLSGNIHNIHDATDIVVGFISAGAVAKKRIFIASEQLPNTFVAKYPYECGIDSAFFDDPHSHFNTVLQKLVSGAEVPVNAIFGMGGPSPIGYTGSDISCIDCTLRGSKQQPDFWK
ncbi:MAG: DUF4249 domain-containing protein [Mucilaginibacter sp.]